MSAPSLYDSWSIEQLVQEKEALQWRLAEAELDDDPAGELVMNGMVFVADWILEIDAVLDKRRAIARGGNGPTVAKPRTESIYRLVAERIDLLTFCGRYGPILKPKGRDSWFALCPFPDHNERTGSFHVTPSKNQWHCFGCNRGGDLFHLAQAMFQTPGTIEAARMLANAYGIETGEQKRAEQQAKPTSSYVIETEDGRLVPMNTPMRTYQPRRYARS